MALMHFSWAMDLDPKGANSQIKDALDPTINNRAVQEEGGGGGAAATGSAAGSAAGRKLNAVRVIADNDYQSEYTALVTPDLSSQNKFFDLAYLILR